MVSPALIEELAPQGILRAGINMSNFLLVSETKANGEIDGVSPRMAAAIATELGVELQLIQYKGPGDVADAAQTNGWDIANIAAEAERARFISFSAAYCEIQATYLVPPGSTIKTLEDVDRPGVRIAVKERAAYDLWLVENLKHATLHKAASIDDSFTLFQDEGLEVLAGLRPKLIEQQLLMRGSTLFDKSFTAVQQSVGCQTGKPLASAYLQDFVKRSKQTGLVSSLIDQFGVQGRLSVAP
ncbi:transporter substrate-binding domain-containing protein [Granulosicoccus sp.]|nr:transporter substrate-binding domain-containing protein [Granulosicoccus sp.]MDB4223805.1 transporter substrate-binding domain-containing protein [Granulosicoccus sp.]